MFTGLVEEVGTVREATTDSLAIQADITLRELKAGDSIAVNGACLTITSLDDSSFRADVMPETLRCTNLGAVHYADKVNLERALMLGERLGGHLVLGHVDDVGEVMSLVPEESAKIMRVSAPANLMSYVARKGFIAVDGVSLTVVDLDDFSFSVSLVAHTLAHTTLSDRRPGGRVNLEADVIARYVERLSDRNSRGVTLDLLMQNGFMKRES